MFGYHSNISTHQLIKGILLTCLLLHCICCNTESTSQPIISNEPNEPTPSNSITADDIPIAQFCSYTSNDKLTDYIEESKKKGVKPQKDIRKLDKLINNQELILVPDISWSYIIRKSPNSYRYLTPKANNLLLSICEEFMRLKSNTSLWKIRPTITSMLRTIEAIGKIRNKSKSNNSSHLHGTTFDISYVTFYDESGIEAQLHENELNYLKELLACVVENHRTAGKCYKTFEQGQQSHCIHVVCR